MFDRNHISDFHEYDSMASLVESAYSKIKFIPDTMLLLEITLLRILRRNGEKPIRKSETVTQAPQKMVEVKETTETPEVKKEIPVEKTPLKEIIEEVATIQQKADMKKQKETPIEAPSTDKT